MAWGQSRSRSKVKLFDDRLPDLAAPAACLNLNSDL
jgi:hypothetical protein